jgi:hypothetical protein
MRYVVNSMQRAGLGATSDQTTIDTGSVLNVGDQLRQAQADLTNLLGAMQQNPQLAQAIGRDVIAQQQALGDLISKYVYVYTAIFGNPPVGLGVAQIVVAGVAVVAVLGVIAAGLVVWWEKESAIKQQAQAATIASQNQAALIAQAQAIQQQADAARAAGDTATAATLDYRANQIFAQAGTPNTSGLPPQPAASFLDWLKNNWILAAMIGGGIFVAAKAVD